MRFSKAADTYTREAHVQRHIAQKMIHLLTHHLPTPCERIVEFGCGTGIYSRLLLQHLQPQQLLLNDICNHMLDACQDLRSQHVSFLLGDAETLSFPKETQLLTSCSALQWFDAPETFFVRCNNYLASNGYLAFTTFGKENLKEIRQLTGSGLNYRSLQELREGLTPQFDIIHAEEEVIPLTFGTPLDILYHLKQTGVTATAPRTWTRGELATFCTQYTQLFGCQESVALTYHPIYIIAKRHTDEK